MHESHVGIFMLFSTGVSVGSLGASLDPGFLHLIVTNLLDILFPTPLQHNEICIL